MNEDSLKTFGGGITALIGGRDFTRQEMKDLFSEILLNEQTEMQQGAFMAALSAKGETATEIAAVWEAIYEIDTVKVSPKVDGPLVDNCGTGMDTFKTFNISTAASIIAAAGGVSIARHGARAITSACGTVDIVEALGVDVECVASIVSTSIEQAGIGLFNGMSPTVHPQALGRILSQIRFGTTLNIAGSLANPARPKYGVRGVYSREMVLPVAGVMREMGYKKALVFFGSCGELGGMDEISTLGETFIAKLDESGDLETFTVRPEDFGIPAPDASELGPLGDPHAEALNLVKLLNGTETGPRRDIVCLNAAPVLYVAGKVQGLKEGYETAREIVASGTALDKLKEWVAVQNTVPASGVATLEAIMQKL